MDKDKVYKEIQNAVHDIHRNLTILYTNASPEQRLMIDRGMDDMCGFDTHDLPNIKKAFE
jgi:hypothetical protein